jgi:hypothetical protein
LTPDDRSEATQDEDRISWTRPTIVRRPEEVVEQFLDFIATTLEVPEPHERARPNGNDHGHPEVDIGLSLVHDRESRRISSGQLVGAKALLRTDVGPQTLRSRIEPRPQRAAGGPSEHSSPPRPR